MEASGVVLRQIPKISGIGAGTLNQRFDFAPNSSSSVAMVNNGIRKVKKLRAKATAMDCGFKDKASLMYYGDCGTAKERKDAIKKQLKVLSKDLIQLPITADFTQSQADTIKEATELLKSQLQQLKSEEKERKKQRKAEKKAMRMKKIGCESSSSSSSESSDSDCDNINNASRLRTEPAVTITLPRQNDLPAILEATTTLTLPVSLTEEKAVTSISTKRIEVCMGNKCKKFGSEALLEEFKKVPGVEDMIVGCKCMGKCKVGPNVRVSNFSDDGFDQSVRTRPNSIYNGVGLEDVGAIVSNLCCFDNRNGLVLPPPLA